jgi:multidrug efflux pump subunit AcrA (membrane-fusion protein)
MEMQRKLGRLAEQLEERLVAERKEAERKVERLEAERKAERLEVEQKMEQLKAERLADKQRVERLEEQKEARRIEVQGKLKGLADELAERKTEKTQVKSQEMELSAAVQIEPMATRVYEEENQSNSGCKYYFGYLCEREKGEVIPSACLECPKSLDCMLTRYRSKESVAEIKKWYPVKA